MLQRLRGAIDQRIADEQARQRATQQTPPARSSSLQRRSHSRTLSSATRTASPRDGDGDGSGSTPAPKGPDPSEFDPEFVIGDEHDMPSRTVTPRPHEKAPPAEAPTRNGEEPPSAAAGTEVEGPLEIPPHIQTRLRKLDKLEPKYTGTS